MKRRSCSSFLIGPAAILLLFSAGCKDATNEINSPLSPPAWIQGSWVDLGYIEESLHGSSWEFTQDNAIRYDYMYGSPHLAPWDYLELYLDCLQGINDSRYSLADYSSDTYYEIHEILVACDGCNPYAMTHRFIKLTPTTFRYNYTYLGGTGDGGVYTRE
jgi:hypothetical protein